MIHVLRRQILAYADSVGPVMSASPFPPRRLVPLAFPLRYQGRAAASEVKCSLLDLMKADRAFLAAAHSKEAIRCLMNSFLPGS